MTIISGTSVADILNGTIGDDTINAGAGNDRIFGSQGTDVVDGEAGGSDRLTFITGDSAVFTHATSARTYTITASTVTDSSGTINTTFSGIENLILSTWGNGNFNDTIDLSGFGPAAGQTIAPNLTVLLGTGDNTVIGSSYADYVVFTGGANTVDAGAGADTVYYQPNLTSGATTFVGRTGSTITATQSGVTTTITNAETLLFGSYGNFTGSLRIDASAADFSVILVESNGNDVLIGGTGDDIISASGDGTLTSAKSGGVDVWTGGAGSDIFDFTFAAEGMNGTTITDLSSQDVIDFNYNDPAIGSALLVNSFIGSSNFSGVAGQYRSFAFEGQTYVQVDFNGDAVADGTLTISSGEFILAETGNANGVHALTIAQVLNAATPTSAGDYLYGTGNGDTINGLEGNDNISGYGGNDVLNGGDGNDQLNGGLGQDQLFGDAGDDTLVIANTVVAGDVFNGGSGTDTLLVLTNSGTTAPVYNGFISRSGVLPATFSSVERLQFGSAPELGLSITISVAQIAAAGLTELSGGAGFDQLTIIATNGGTFTAPTFTYANWNGAGVNDGGDTVALVGVGNFNYVLNAATGHAGTQVLLGGLGNDTLNGTAGAEFMDGGAGVNILNGGDGDDGFGLANLIQPNGTTSFLTYLGNELNGGAGHDLVSVGGYVDFQGSWSSIEEIYFRAPFDGGSLSPTTPDSELEIDAGELATLPGNLVLSGVGILSINLEADSYDASGWVRAAGSDVLVQFYGSNAALTLVGTSGSDRFASDGGTYTLTGGAGADAFEAGFGQHTVTDFQVGVDRVDLTDMDITSFEQAQHYLTQVGSDVVFSRMYGGVAQTMTLRNVSLGALNAESFLFQTDNEDDVRIGTEQVDELIGAGGNDTLNGLGGNDRLFSGAGNDYLTGGDGDDVIDAGAGQDIAAFVLSDVPGRLDIIIGTGVYEGKFVVQRTNGSIVEDVAVITYNGPNSVTVQGINSEAHLGTDTVTNIEDLHFYTAGTFDPERFTTGQIGVLQPGGPGNGVEGSYFDDVINLADYPNAGFVDGAEGNDTIVGTEADEYLNGSEGNDTINGGGGRDQVQFRLPENMVGTLSVYQQSATDFYVLRQDGSTTEAVAWVHIAGGVTTVTGLNSAAYLGTDTITNVHELGFMPEGPFDQSRSAFIHLTPGTYNGQPYGSVLDDVADFSASQTGVNYFADFGNDTVTGSGFADQLSGGAGNDVLGGAGGNDIIHGHGGNDILRGGAGDDMLYGEQGNDILSDGGALVGNDTYDGGAGGDRVSYFANSLNGVTVDLRITGPQNTGHGSDTLINIEHVNTDFGDDVLIGNESSNWFWTYSGNDTLSGNGGNDQFTVGQGTKIIDGGAGEDVVEVDDTANQPLYSISGVNISLALQGQAQETGVGAFTLTNVENLSGNYGNDHLTGDGNANKLAGYLGDDTLVGGAGDDTLSGDGTFAIDQNGVVWFDQFADWTNAGGNDTLQGGAGADTLIGGRGNDSFTGTVAELNGDTIVDFTSTDRILITDAVLSNFSFSVTGSTLSFAGSAMTLTGFSGHLRATAAVGGGVELRIGEAETSPRDFNGDGRDDMLLRHASGMVFDWLGQANGALTSNYANAGWLDPSWQMLATGDFNGDGRGDILLKHANGTIFDWLGDANGGFTSNYAHASWVDPSWETVGTGDFNGDGRDDLLLRHSTGMVMNLLGGTDGGLANNYANSGWLDPSWQMLASGDFNGDGRDDILLQHANGTLFDWLGQANGGFTSNYANAAWLDPSWERVGTGDFNGDGRDDLLLRHSSGMVTNLLGDANGGFTNNYANAGWLDPSWQLAAIGDFNGDGRDDMLLRHANGVVFDWLGNASGGFTSNYDNAGWLDPSWNLASTGDFNGDGRDDMLLRHANGTVFDWLGQANGGFMSNYDNAGWLDPSWELAANPSKVGLWDA